MKILAAWMIVCSAVAFGGETAEPVSVLKNAPEAAKPVVVSDCANCCVNCNVYSEKTDERSTCRKTIFGKVVKRDFKRTVLTPVR
jgi:hypothetical protein